MKRADGETRLRKLCHIVDIAAGTDPPETLYRALDDAFAAVIGHRLFTLMAFDEHTHEAERVYTSDAAHYPVGGRKQMAKTPWAEAVIGGRRAWVGRNAADIRWAYPDHELIARLGLHAALNLPIVYAGRFLGTVNLLHDEGYYDDRDAEIGKPFAALLVPRFLGLAP